MIVLSSLALAFMITSSQAAPAWPSVSTPVAQNGLGVHDAAVVAGIGAYFVLPPVPGAADNATDWFQWLTSSRGVPLEKVRLMRDGDVTREDLLAAVTHARGQVGPEGTLWIVFIGHGAPSKSGDDGLLLGVDAQRTEISVENRGLPQKTLLAAADGVRVVALFDACFSGMTSDGKTPLVAGSQATLPVRRIDDVKPGVVVLSSSDQIAGPLPGGDRPAFSYLMLGAARGWGDRDDDATVTLDEAFGYVRSTLVTVVRDKNQTPTMRGVARGISVATNATERGPDLARYVAARSEPSAPRERPPAESAAARERFKQRELHIVGGEGEWAFAQIVRGPYKSPVETADVLAVARERAPDAAGVVEELEGKMSFAANAVPYTAIGGAVLGVAVGFGIGAFAPAETFGDDDIVRYVALPAASGAIGSMAIMTMVGLPLGLGMTPTQDDITRLNLAKKDLAAAANAVERETLAVD